MNILGLNITRDSAWDIVGRSQPASPEARGVTISEQGWIGAGALGMRRSASGARISEEGSLQIAAVYACVRVLAESVASLPLKLYRRSGAGREVARDHALYPVLQARGNDVMSAMKLREVMMVHLCLWGNFYGELQRNGRGDVVAIWPIHPARVTPKVAGTARRPSLVFDVRDTKTGKTSTLTQDQILFIPGLGTDLVGRSPIALHREGLGITVQAERYGAAFFKNDARPGIVLETPNTLGDEAFEHLKSSWAEAHEGPDKAYKPAILEEGLTAKTVGLPPDDAQFIETRKYQKGEVASIFRVPPHMIGDLDKATFSNIEHQGLEFVTHSLRPWLVRIEQGVSMSLLDEDERGEVYAEHLVDALLRGDISSRYDAYTKGRNWGWLSVNDVRERENMNPVENGDLYLQPLNMVEAGADPMGASGDDLPMGDGDPDAASGARGARRVRIQRQKPVETRALPERYREAKALETTFRTALSGVVRREVREIRDAVDDLLASGDVEAFTDRVVAFADDHEAWTARRMAPAYRAMADAMIEAARGELGEELDDDALDTFVREYVAAFAKRHAGSTRGQVLALVEEAADGEEAEAVEERLSEWEGEGSTPSRAQTQARRERQRSSNAFTKAAWGAVGVATLTWRAVGKSCPICDEMDGRTSRITQAFVSEGDTVADLDVSSRVTHPPIHDGCDCILMPGSGSRSRPTAAELRSLLSALLEEAGGTPLAPEARSPEAPTTWAQRRNAWMHGEYVRRRGAGEERTDIIEDLRAGTFEEEAYSLEFSTCRRVCDARGR